MDKNTTRPHSATRSVETTQGILTYAHLKALRAADRLDWTELIAVWKRRFEEVRLPQ